MRATIYKCGISCLLALWAMSVYATSHWLAPNHPDTYQVKEGDTLWDIAGRFLNEPWRWPEVWKNSDIKNPHLIYPGDEIVLSMDGDSPQLSVRRGKNSERAVYKDGRKIVKLSPRVRSAPAERAIPTIPLSAIGPFLTRTKITSVGELESAHTIGTVDDERLLVSEGNRFYSANLNMAEGEALSVFRPGKILIHPISGVELGQEAIYLGAAKVETADVMSTLVLQKGVEEARSGDYLLPVEDDRIEPYYFPKLPVGEAQGYILSVLGGINQVGQNQVITISGGHDISREEGDVLAVLQAKKDLSSRVTSREKFERKIHRENDEQLEFSPLKVGRIIVFKVFDHTSLALVMDAVRTIHLRDEVRRP